MNNNSGSPHGPIRPDIPNTSSSQQSPQEISTFWQNLINKNAMSSLPQDGTGEIAPLSLHLHLISTPYDDDWFKDDADEPHTAEVEKIDSSEASHPEANTDWRVFLRERRMISKRAHSSAQGWEGASEAFEHEMQMQKQIQEPRPEVIAAIQEIFKSRELDEYLSRKANKNSQ